MTGIGRNDFVIEGYECSIDIKSLNGKQLEINLKIPPVLKLYEIEIRNIIQEKLIRGSIEIQIQLKNLGLSKMISVNTSLAKYYYECIEKIADELLLEKKDILSTIMRMPEIVSTPNDTIDESLWTRLQLEIIACCESLLTYRKKEGEALYNQIIQNINSIHQLCLQIEPLEHSRKEKMKEKLLTAILNEIPPAQVDKNRLEQELIYYIEKIDITEEKSRLLYHCQYFHELVNMADITKGKKLGFLMQEIGREINTIGSKANDMNIQKIVIDMKDQLEQAKEQLLNIL
jgi:conserved hypothetical protein TIGR00255